MWSVRQWLAVAVGTVILDISMFWLLRQEGPGISREHATMENLQAFLLFLATLVFLRRIKTEQDASAKAILVCGALLGFTMFVREFDVRKLDVPRFVVLLGSGVVKDTFLTVLWVAGTCNVAVRVRAAFRVVSASLPLGSLIPFGLSASFLVLGELFEKKVFPVEPHVFYEELWELNGFLVFLAASCFLPHLSPGEGARAEDMAAGAS